MTLAGIITNGHGRAGSGGSWEVRSDGQTCELWHYQTRMLAWNAGDPTDDRVLYACIGRGSVSDQNGLNIAFRALNLPYRFDRDQRGGGPRIASLKG